MRRLGTTVLLTSAIVLFLSLPAQAALRLTPNLTSIRFVEVTGVGIDHVFGANSSQMLTQLANPLSVTNRDFFGLGHEHYDVFYSDANGVADQDGDFITVEAQFEQSFGGGGLNIDEVYLVFADGTEQCACAVASAVYLGPNFVAGSAARAADCTTGNNSTMGSTSGPNERLRITLDYDCPTPASPLTWGRLRTIYK